MEKEESQRKNPNGHNAEQPGKAREGQGREEQGQRPQSCQEGFRNEAMKAKETKRLKWPTVFNDTLLKSKRIHWI